jgi:hypothetical protein
MIATDVSHNGKWWRVSTINRECRSMAGHGHKYAETLVWDWDAAAQKEGGIHHIDSDSEGEIRTHLNIVEKIYESGAFWEAVEESK